VLPLRAPEDAASRSLHNELESFGLFYSGLGSSVTARASVASFHSAAFRWRGPISTRKLDCAIVALWQPVGRLRQIADTFSAYASMGLRALRVSQI